MICSAYRLIICTPDKMYSAYKPLFRCSNSTIGNVNNIIVQLRKLGGVYLISLNSTASAPYVHVALALSVAAGRPKGYRKRSHRFVSAQMEPCVNPIVWYRTCSAQDKVTRPYNCIPTARAAKEISICTSHINWSCILYSCRKSIKTQIGINLIMDS